MQRLLPALSLAVACAASAFAAPFDDPQTPRPAAAAAGPDARATYLALIRELRGQQPYAALAHVAGYEARWGASPDTTILRADALRATGQDEAATAAYRALLATPQAAPAHRGLGLIAAAAGRWDAAIASLSEAARLDPTDAGTLGDLGLAQMRAGRLDAARIPLMTAAQLAPTDSRLLANLASWFLAAGEPARAEAVLRSPHLSEAARALLQAQLPAVAPAPDAPARGLRLAHSLTFDGARAPAPARETTP